MDYLDRLEHQYEEAEKKDFGLIELVAKPKTTVIDMNSEQSKILIINLFHRTLLFGDLYLGRFHPDEFRTFGKYYDHLLEGKPVLFHLYASQFLEE